MRVRALHLHEVQGLFKHPVDIAFICTKSYDTEWATMMIKQYLAPNGFLVTLQNGINEERIANIVGWGKVVGCIASTIGLDAYKAGHVMRTMQPGERRTRSFAWARCTAAPRRGPRISCACSASSTAPR